VVGPARHVELVAPELEVVVKEYPEFWLVEKRGEAEEIAEETE
jgi:hypothetical protein